MLIMYLSVFDKNIPYLFKYLNHIAVWKTIQSCFTVFPYALKTYKNMGNSLPTRTCRSRITMVRRVVKIRPQITTWTITDIRIFKGLSFLHD